MPPDEVVCTPQPGRSRGSSPDDIPLAKRQRTVLPADTAAAAGDGTLAPSLSASQVSGYDPASREGERQSRQEIVQVDPVGVNINTKPCASVSALYQTIVTLEYGDKLGAQYPVHLELLCSHSSKQRKVFFQAEALIERYKKFKWLRKQVKALFPPRKSSGAFYDNKVRDKAMNLIMEAMNSSPLSDYQDALKDALVDTTDSAFQNSELFKVDPKKAKLDRSRFPREQIRDRLQLLKPEAVRLVTERLNIALSNMKAAERKKAEHDVVKAAAQRRIILPTADRATVESLVEWLYKNRLSFTDADQLYQVHTLAHSLGMMVLATACMEKLATATMRVLDQAKLKGVALRQLLENVQELMEETETKETVDPLITVRVVATVFKLVLQTKEPPAVLQNLVVDTFAESGDADLVEELLPVMDNDIRGQILLAMFRKPMKVVKTEHTQPQVHSSTSPAGSIKSELQYDELPDAAQNWDMEEKDVVKETVITNSEDAACDHYDLHAR